MDVSDRLEIDIDPLEDTTNLESKYLPAPTPYIAADVVIYRFYAKGYDSGHAHGQLHGLFEGRALGSEKGFEIWEEVGHYEGWAFLWVDLLITEGKEGR